MSYLVQAVQHIRMWFTQQNIRMDGLELVIRVPSQQRAHFTQGTYVMEMGQHGEIHYAYKDPHKGITVDGVTLVFEATESKLGEDWTLIDERIPANTNLLFTTIENPDRQAFGWYDTNFRKFCIIGGNWTPTHWRRPPDPVRPVEPTA